MGPNQVGWPRLHCGVIGNSVASRVSRSVEDWGFFFLQTKLWGSLSPTGQVVVMVSEILCFLTCWDLIFVILAYVHFLIFSLR